MKKFIKNLWDGTKNYLVHYTQTQLAITLISLPILVGWGLGFSWMTFVGNLVFAPVLTIFLIISSLLLFTQLIGIPNGYLALALDWLTLEWNSILNLGSASWIAEYAKPPTMLLISIPIVTFLVLHHRTINTHTRRLLTLCFLMALCGVLLMIQRCHHNNTQGATAFHEKLYVIKLIDKPSIIVIDEGFFARKKSVEKAVDFELKPWINKMYGSVAINELRITKPGMGSFKAAAYICTRWNVATVSLPFFETTLNKVGWRSYFELKRLLEQKGIRFVRYANPPASA